MEIGKMQDFTAILEPADEGGYICWLEEIPDAMSQGETQEEALINVIDALKLLLETNKEQAENNLRGKNIIRKSIPICSL